MPHLRLRHLQPSLEKALKHSPLVGVLGHRQVGKTTLVSQLVREYLSFDDFRTLGRAEDDAAEFLASLKTFPAALDECQLVPRLFPALKERVRKVPRPGQFLLSGSVRFTSRKAIQESLTGRILNFELLPFSIPELESRELPQSFRDCLREKDFTQANPFVPRPSAAALRKTQKNIDTYLHSGGLPGVCFIRQKDFRDNKIQEQLLTLLDRDLRLVHPTSLGYREILEFVQALARLEGEPINHSDLQRTTGVSAVSQKKLLYALEALFVIRLIPVEGGRKGQIVFFEDQAESHFLTQGALSDLQQLAGLLYRNLRTQWSYTLGSSCRFFHYLTPGGARVPFAVQEGSKTLGVLPFEGPSPSRSVSATAASFLSAYGDSKILLVSSSWKQAPKALDARTLIVSTVDLMF